MPSGWVVTNFGTLLSYEQPTKYIVNDTNYKPTYKTPVLTAGKSFILGYTNETDNIFDDLPVIIFDDFTTESKFVDFPFKVKSSAMKILHINQDLVLPKYAFYLMQATDIDHDNHQRYWISTYSQEIVALPPINEQERILTTLEHYYNLLDTLQWALKRAYRKLALMFSTRANRLLIVCAILSCSSIDGTGIRILFIFSWVSFNLVVPYT